jgi:adenine phosphoribosyltransferase
MLLDADQLRSRIRDIADWPRPGITFHDITPLLADASAFHQVVTTLADHHPRTRTDASGRSVDLVVGVEARGFILAAPVALRIDAGFVPVRKAGKLPAAIEAEEYTLEYGSDLLEIHNDAISPGQRVLIVDDVLATGGTAAAVVRLVRRLGGEVAGVACLLELPELGGRALVGDVGVMSIVSIGVPAGAGTEG